MTKDSIFRNFKLHMLGIKTNHKEAYDNLVSYFRDIKTVPFFLNENTDNWCRCAVNYNKEIVFTEGLRDGALMFFFTESYYKLLEPFINQHFSVFEYFIKFNPMTHNGRIYPTSPEKDNNGNHLTGDVLWLSTEIMKYLKVSLFYFTIHPYMLKENDFGLKKVKNTISEYLKD